MKKTVFVIGAGASKEVHLPTGDELKKIISKLLDIQFSHLDQTSGDRLLRSALEYITRTPDGLKGDINPYLKEAWHIRDALPMAISIDNFIDSQRGNEKIATCGKLAICRGILAAEKDSLLFFESPNFYDKYDSSLLEGTWYLPFFQLLTENCVKSELEERFASVTLIIFNYDRCVEHFLFSALKNYYDLSNEEATRLIQAINIYHPYGSIGELPWQNKDHSIDFGIVKNAKNLVMASERIKTFTEGTDPEESEILAIRQDMGSASRVVFIGFAFHRLNMQLITPNRGEKGAVNPKCYATTYGISDSDKEVISNQINDLFGKQVDTKMVNEKCADFFSEFWRSLAF